MQETTLGAFGSIYARFQADHDRIIQQWLTQRTREVGEAVELLAQPSIVKLTYLYATLENRRRVSERRRSESDERQKSIVEELEGLQQALREEFQNRWMGKEVQIRDYSGRSKHHIISISDFLYLGTSDHELRNKQLSGEEAKLRVGHALALVRRKKPWWLFESGLGDWWKEEQNAVREGLKAAQIGVLSARDSHYRLLTEEGNKLRELEQVNTARVTNEVNELRKAIHALFETVSEASTFTAWNGASLQSHLPEGSIGEGIPSQPLDIVTGHGPLRFQVGWTSHALKLTLGRWYYRDEAEEYRPFDEKELNVDLGFAPLTLPFVLDLQQLGGFITDNYVTVKSFLLRLLRTLPAGSVNLSVYDPKEFGNAVNYLFPLGDHRETVLGKNGVATSDQQFQNMLGDVENYIGMINQNYLSGKYPDVVSYNLHAPVQGVGYRVMLINDDCAAWTDGVRADWLNRLRRIVLAGARCGVFVLVKSTMVADLGLPVLIPGSSDLHTSWTGVETPTPQPATWTGADIARDQTLRRFIALETTWDWVPPSSDLIDPQGVAAIVDELEGALASAGKIVIEPSDLTAVVRRYRAQQAAKQIAFGPPVVTSSETDAWWAESSVSGVAAYVGVDSQDQSKPLLLQLDESDGRFGGLFGGMPGTGKSTFLHAVIFEFVRRYSPSELELYLVDVKSGVEFSPYARWGLPHAKVIALESGREFAVSVLEDLVSLVNERYELFKAGRVAGLSAYREETGEIIPRVVLVMDEFAMIFEDDDELTSRGRRALARLVQQGRAAGVHVILSAHSLRTYPHTPTLILQQLPQRVTFNMPQEDSQLFLRDGNYAGSTIFGKGHGIFNGNSGWKDANREFQGVRVTHRDVEEMLRLLSSTAREREIAKRPFVLEDAGASSWTEDAKEAASRGVAGLEVTLPIGSPLRLGGDVMVSMRQTIDGNCLVVEPNEAAAGDALAAFMLGSGMAGAEVEVLEFGATAGRLHESIVESQEILTSHYAKTVEVVSGLMAYERLQSLSALCDPQRGQRVPITRPMVIVVVGLAIADRFDGMSPEAVSLRVLLERGPVLGIHVVVLADSLSTVRARIGSSFGTYFATRIAGECGADSFELIGSRVASRLDSDHQMVVFERATGRTLKVRPFTLLSFTQ